jgi:hypothetical protein
LAFGLARVVDPALTHRVAGTAPIAHLFTHELHTQLRLHNATNMVDITPHPFSGVAFISGVASVVPAIIVKELPTFLHKLLAVRPRNMLSRSQLKD